MLETGLKNSITLTVTEELTADKVGSGALKVYSTPMMIAAMENCCLSCVAPYLEEGSTTVGTLVNVTHDAASPVGAEITVECTLTAVERRKLTFEVAARCADQVIGKGTHERFIVNADKFMSKLG
ncbi:MAG: thioesterase family protein [Clostridia bacterium]|nr:thioesterase family protein [Clostridia bacterium]